MKKISFSFSKSKPVAAKPKSEVKKDIQFIDCIESNSIKLKGELPSKEEEELIIPVLNGKVFKKEEVEDGISEEEGSASPEAPVLAPEAPVLASEASVLASEAPVLAPEAPVLAPESKETLETLAVREILEESHKVKDNNPSTSVQVLPAAAAEGKVAAAEVSTLADYENIPVADFGLAMLRGMGWKPEKGIGKTGKVIEPKDPILRPKGIGLGAEINKVPAVSSDVTEELILKKGAYVQVLGGAKKNMYGEVQSFDEDVGRVFIKAALGGSNISVNESMLRVVSSSEYKKSSRVLNQSKYDEYRRTEGSPDSERRDSRRDLSESKRIKRDRCNYVNGSI